MAVGISALDWLYENLSPSKDNATVFGYGEVWTHIAGLRYCGARIDVYKNDKHYCAHAGNYWEPTEPPIFGFFDVNLSFNELIIQLADKYDEIRSKRMMGIGVTLDRLREDLRPSKDNADVSRCGEVWTHVAGFHKYSNRFDIYKNDKHYCAHYGEKWEENEPPLLGYFDINLPYYDLLVQLADRYDEFRRNKSRPNIAEA